MNHNAPQRGHRPLAVVPQATGGGAVGQLRWCRRPQATGPIVDQMTRIRIICVLEDEPP